MHHIIDFILITRNLAKTVSLGPDQDIENERYGLNYGI